MLYGKITGPAALFFMLLILMVPGCGTYRDSSPTAAIPPAPSTIDLSDIRAVKSVLYAQYHAWKSAPYREGGMSKRGIDCSGFVYLTYRSKFGIDLPRTADRQSSVGTKIAQGSLQAGDLVFFKTGLFRRHVGIFLEDRQFMHASSSNGVMISSLDEDYWSGSYWKAKRISL
jgi:cell wall-associated NlpC family hydrolase